MKIHAESLLQIPLVKAMMNDPSVRFAPRALDSDWTYSKSSPVGLTGFSPSLGKIFYGTESRFRHWLKNPSVSARPWNTGDHLVKEVLFAVHDYLHIWAYQAINELKPKLGLGSVPVTPRNFEVFVFCHLVSEAVATVGLDYWYLSQIDLNTVVPLGTQAFPLAAKYRSSYETEFARFGIKRPIFDPSFFKSLTKFYLSGEFVGFDTDQMRRSPILMNWLSHELTYGDTQRRYTREWLNYLSGGRCATPARRLAGRVSCDESWQNKLIDDVAQLLWRKVVLSENICFSRSKNQDAWSRPIVQADYVDYRFFNLNSVGDDFWRVVQDAGTTPVGAQYLFWQILFKYRTGKLTHEQFALLKKCDPIRELRLMEFILKKVEPLRSRGEPAALFLPN